MKTAIAKPTLCLGVSTLALWAGAFAPVQAQEPAAPAPLAAAAGDPAPANEVGEVVVTGSRTVTNGYSAPTPVTVVSAAQLATAQPQSLSQGLATIPQFRNSASPQSNGSGTSVGSSIGASYLNLRGLGSQRTLVMLDGHRITPTSFLGPSDIGILPEGLISRVDIVTGGASAAYGSDAISGVVNFALDHKFTGLKGLAQGGASEIGDGENYKAGLTFGHDLGDRGHLIVSGEFYRNHGIFDYYDRAWAMRGYAIVAVPGVTDANKSPNNPKNVVVANVRASAGSFGGLITDTALRGTQFLPGGQPAPFQFGSLLTTSTMVGDDGVDAFRDIGLQPDQRRTNLFARFDYDFSADLHGYVQGLYGEDRVIFISGPSIETGANAFTIFNDNAYLPAAVRAQMAAGNIASFHLGRFGRDLGQVTYNNLNRTAQLNAGLTGTLGAGWRYEVYASHGENRDRSRIYNQSILTNLYRAADAVLSPASGQIVCRSTLTNPSDGCAPLNVFGEGSPSAAAKGYILAQALARQRFKEDYVGFSLSGEPLQLPAGPLTLALGAEYRRDKAVQTSDPLSTGVISGAGIRGFPAALNGRVGQLERTNPPVFSGKTHVAEGFIEVLAPVLSDMPLVKSLDVNAAVRYADYARSGGVTTWKVGLTYEPFEDLRFRGTISRDIRAPSLFEQYLTPSTGSQGGPVTDPSNGAVSTNIIITVAGNPDLKPEEADTISYGLVYRPAFIPNFGVSVDYWKVDIANAISQLFQSTPATNAQLLINQCFAGNTELCGAIHRFNGAIISVDNTYFNISRLRASGVDIEANYSRELALFGADSRVTVRGVASYLHELSTQLPGGFTVDRAGDNGQAAAGSPHWTATLNIELERGPLGVYLQERYIGPGKLDNTLSASDIAVNHVPAVFYTDLTLRYRVRPLDHPSELFLTVNNLFDKDPPIDPRFLSFGTIPTNRSLYDVVGRQYTAGVRFQF